MANRIPTVLHIHPTAGWATGDGDWLFWAETRHLTRPDDGQTGKNAVWRSIIFVSCSGLGLSVYMTHSKWLNPFSTFPHDSSTAETGYHDWNRLVWTQNPHLTSHRVYLTG